MTDLEGKVAAVTGGTRGIGLEIARALARAGGTVAISARTGADVDDVVERLEEEGAGEAFGVVADVRRPEDCARFIDDVVERFGRLDVLVNNAGVGHYAPIQELSVEDWQDQIETNLGGVFYCSKAAAPHLSRDGGGWIINIGSLAGRNSFSGGTGYNASKFGLLGMTEAMMLDLRYDDVRVSLIMPGSVNTGFSGREPGPEGDWKLRPEDVARAVVDLLAYPAHALPSRVEMRPTRPPRK